MQGFMKKATQGETPWDEMNFVQQLIFILVDAPWDFLRRITTPPPHPDMWYRRFAIVFPAPAVFFTMATNDWFLFNEAPKWYWYVAEGIALCFSVLFYFTTKNAKPPKWIIVFAIIAFIMSILWINWISNVLIDLLGLLGLMFGIPSAYLGITILAWGNSVGDTVANAGVAKRGLARMAITGCFAGPYFNLSLGIGLSMLIQNISKGKVPDFQIGEAQALLPMMTTIPLIFMLVAIMIATTLFRFTLYKV